MDIGQRDQLAAGFVCPEHLAAAHAHRVGFEESEADGLFSGEPQPTHVTASFIHMHGGFGIRRALQR